MSNHNSSGGFMSLLPRVFILGAIALFGFWYYRQYQIKTGANPSDLNILNIFRPKKTTTITPRPTNSDIVQPVPPRPANPQDNQPANPNPPQQPENVVTNIDPTPPAGVVQEYDETTANQDVAEVVTTAEIEEVPVKKTVKKESANNNTIQKDISKMDENGLFEIESTKKSYSGFGIQIAAYKEYDKAMKHATVLKKYDFEPILLMVSGEKTNKTYRVIVGKFEEKEEAITLQRRLKKINRINGFIVNLEELK